MLKVKDDILGNASTATKLKNTKTLTIGNTGKNFDGTENISWNLSEIGAAASSHNHTNLTGVTNITFATDSTDSASIKTTVEGTNTYFDFMLADDPSQNDQWRWRFTPSGGSIFNAMVLDATSTTTAALTVTGTINATGELQENGTALSSKYSSTSHVHGLIDLSSENFSGTNDLNTYNSNKTWVARTLANAGNRPADYYTVLNVGANSNSNFQIAHSYGNASTMYIRGRHDTTGNYTPWAKVYTDKNKPTASDVGALPLSGGTLTGGINPSTTNSLSLGSSSQVWKDIYLGESKKEESGYTTLPNGLILQWGTNSFSSITTSANPLAVYYDKPFPNKCLNFTVSAYNISTGTNNDGLRPSDYMILDGVEHTNQCFYIKAQQFSGWTLKVRWFAIGY